MVSFALHYVLTKTKTRFLPKIGFLMAQIFLVELSYDDKSNKILRFISIIAHFIPNLLSLLKYFNYLRPKLLGVITILVIQSTSFWTKMNVTERSGTFYGIFYVTVTITFFKHFFIINLIFTEVLHSIYQNIRPGHGHLLK